MKERKKERKIDRRHDKKSEAADDVYDEDGRGMGRTLTISKARMTWVTRTRAGNGSHLDHFEGADDMDGKDEGGEWVAPWPFRRRGRR